MLKINSNYTYERKVFQLYLPIDTEVMIPKDSKVRLLDQVLEELDYTKLYQSYRKEGRKYAVEPKDLFKVIIYAASKGIYSSRKIEEECRSNINYMYLLRNQKAPDHNTINRYRKRLSIVIEELLSELVMKLYESGEIDFENLMIDGTKIEANANRYSFIWKGSIEKNHEKLQSELQRYFREEDRTLITGEYLRREERKLLNIAKREKLVFVSGKGHRKSELQRAVEYIQESRIRMETYEKALGTFRGRNSYSRTDEDATFMHMKDDHMRNGQLKAGYNIQAGVENEYIVGIDISDERADVNTLIPYLERIEKNYGRRFANLVADAGYESEENYHYLKEKGIHPYIKPSNYEYSKTRKFQREMEFRLSMEYDREKDEYTCRNGRKLRYSSNRSKESKTGYISTSRIYRCEDCTGCPYLGKCYKGKHTKSIQVSERFDQYREESLENITSEKGNILRINRSIQAEGVFGITKQDMGFTRFLTRGMHNVRTEYLILAIAFNINKLHNRIQEGRLGLKLFQEEKLIS